MPGQHGHWESFGVLDRDGESDGPGRSLADRDFQTGDDIVLVQGCPASRASRPRGILVCSEAYVIQVDKGILSLTIE